MARPFCLNARRTPRRLAGLVIAALLLAGCSETPTGTGQKPGEKSGTKPSADPAAPVDGKGAAANDKGAATVKIELAGPEDLQKHLDALAKEGKVVLVDYWGTWCAPCRKNFPHTVKLLAENADKLAVITIAFEDNPSESKDVTDFLNEQKADKTINLLCRFPLDEGFEKFQLTGQLPEYRVYARDGKLKKRFSAEGDPFSHSDIAESVKDALKE